jgi:cell division protein FtsZ
MDLSIGEFEEVGNTVKQFACDDATVVVGTVIDPELRDELRVTLVATGLGGMPQVEVQKPAAVTLVQAEAETATPTQDVDYGKYDRPTVQRHERKEHKTVARTANGDFDLDYLDIPAFLRKQAD